MSIPPYLLGPNPWAQMMAQQQAHAQLAAAQAAHAQAAAAQAQAAHHAHMQAMSGAGPPLPQPPKQPETAISEDKLQEKGKSIYVLFFSMNNNVTCFH